MGAHDPYALTQVPSPVIQPGGGLRTIGSGRTVVIGEESDRTPTPAKGSPPAKKPASAKTRVAQYVGELGSPHTGAERSAFRQAEEVGRRGGTVRGAAGSKGSNAMAGIIAVVIGVFIVFNLLGACASVVGDALTDLEDEASSFFGTASSENEFGDFETLSDGTIVGGDGVSYYYDEELDEYYTADGRTYCWDIEIGDYVEEDAGTLLNDDLYGKAYNALNGALSA